MQNYGHWSEIGNDIESKNGPPSAKEMRGSTGSSLPGGEFGSVDRIPAPSPLEPVTPEEAVERFIREKWNDGDFKSEKTEETVRHALQHFLDRMESVGVTNLNNLSRKQLQDYKFWLQEHDKGFASSTLEVYLTWTRALIANAEKYRGVPEDFSKTIDVPTAGDDGSRNEILLEEDQAKRIHAQLEREEPVSRRHVEFVVLADCGLRREGLRSLDVQDFVIDDGGSYLRVVDREEEGTNLKKDEDSDRCLDLRPATSELLQKWIENHRPDVEDKYGRDPLIATTHGRVSKSCVTKDMQRITAPCYVEEECPGCNQDDRNQKCPEALSPHPIRRGAYTRDMMDPGRLPEHVRERYDVTKAVADDHYDGRSKKDEMETRRRAYVRGKDEVENK